MDTGSAPVMIPDYYASRKSHIASMRNVNTPYKPTHIVAHFLFKYKKIMFYIETI